MKPRALRFAAGALAAGSSASNAAIVVFDINPDYTPVMGNGYYDGIHVGALNFSNGTFSGGSTSFSLLAGYYFVGFGSGNVRTASNQSNFLGESWLTIFSANDTIGAGVSFDASAAIYSRPEYMPTGTYYLALQLTNGQSVHYGWFELSAVPAGFLGGNRQFTFTRFAFNDVAGASILAGDVGTPVPEASTLGFAGGLFGLVAAAHLRRRKAKQAAASDKFLALAAGEKLN